MALEETAQKALRRIEDALDDYDLSDDDRKQILKIINKSLIRTVEHTSSAAREAAVICCGPEADLAHKIQEEYERKIKALISNLQALR